MLLPVFENLCEVVQEVRETSPSIDTNRPYTVDFRRPFDLLDDIVYLRLLFGRYQVTLVQQYECILLTNHCRDVFWESEPSRHEILEEFRYRQHTERNICAIHTVM